MCPSCNGAYLSAGMTVPDHECERKITMLKPDPIVYHSIELDGRANVREPIPPPRMRLVRPNGRIVTVDLTEGQLLQMLTDVAETLRRMRACRNATQPNGVVPLEQTED